MIGGAIGEIIATLAVKFLQAYWARADLKSSVRNDIALAASGLALKAEEWKAAHPVPDGGDPFADLLPPGDGPKPVSPHVPAPPDPSGPPGTH